MKKLILFLTLFIPLAVSAQIDPVVIGSFPNDGRGDNLRTIAQKINANDAYLDTMGVQRLDSLLTAGVGGGGLTSIITTQVNALTATIDGMTAYEDGMPLIVFHDGATSTGTVTLNINGLGAKSVLKSFGNPAAVGSGEWKNGSVHLIAYDASANFGTGAFRVADVAIDNDIKYLPKTGGSITSGFSLIQTADGQTLELVSENGTGLIINNHETKADMSIAAQNSSGEAAGFIGDLDNIGGLGRGFYFGDFRAVPKGLQYLGVGYEDTGNDSTLISKGWANSKYIKSTGNTDIAGGTSFTLPSDQLSLDPVFSYKWADTFNGTNYFMDFTTFQDDFFSGLGPTVRFGSDNGNGGPLLLKATHQPELSSWFDDLTYITKKYADDNAFNGSAVDGNGIQWNGTTLGLSGSSGLVTSSINFTPSTNGTLNFLAGSSTGNAYNAFHVRSSGQSIFYIPSGFFRVSGSATSLALDIEAGADYEITSDDLPNNGFSVSKTGDNKKIFRFSDTGLYVNNGVLSDFTDLSEMTFNKDVFTVKINGNGNVIDFSDATVGTVKTVITGSAALDFPSVSAGQCADLTINITGATVGDPVTVGSPEFPAFTYFDAQVTSSNTVTVRFCNNQFGIARDLASGTFKVVVHK